jgi:hypothetical protein
LRITQILKRGDGRVHDVERVVRTEALAQHVMDASALDDGADSTAGDDAGTSRSGAKQHATGTEVTDDLVRNAGALKRNVEEVLAGDLVGLTDGLRDLAGLAVAGTDPAVLVTDDHQGRESETAAALDDLCGAVDVDHAVHQITEGFNVNHG